MFFLSGAFETDHSFRSNIRRGTENDEMQFVSFPVTSWMVSPGWRVYLETRGWHGRVLQFGLSRRRSRRTSGDYLMRFKRIVFASLALLLLASASTAQDGSTGGIKGKVRVETGKAAGVTVVVRQGEREVNRVVTDKGGSFLVQRLPAGRYGLTFRKPGLSVGTVENVEVRAGKTRSLGDRLILTIDEGSIAFIRGSIFNQDGRSVAGAKVELGKIQEDGSVQKIDGRVSNEIGAFVFRLTPDTAKYRVTVKHRNAEPVSQDVNIDGAAVYRVALSVPADPK